MQWQFSVMNWNGLLLRCSRRCCVCMSKHDVCERQCWRRLGCSAVYFEIDNKSGICNLLVISGVCNLYMIRILWTMWRTCSWMRGACSVFKLCTVLIYSEMWLCSCSFSIYSDTCVQCKYKFQVIKMDYRDPEVLKELAEQKEKEWKDIADKRFMLFIYCYL